MKSIYRIFIRKTSIIRFFYYKDLFFVILPDELRLSDFSTVKNDFFFFSRSFNIGFFYHDKSVYL